MKSIMLATSFFRSLFNLLLIAMIFSSFMVEQVEAQNETQGLRQLFHHIGNLDLDSIRAAVEKEPALLTQQYSRNKRTPLHEAINTGNDTVVDLLLELGAPTDAVDRHKLTPLHFALSRRQPKIIKSVMAKTENINRTDGRRKATPLMFFVMHRHDDMDLLKTMLQRGADVNLVNSSKQTALHIACYNKQLESAKALLEAGADLEPQDNNANTPLLAGCMISPELTSELLSRGADPLATNRQGQTALHLICQASWPNSDWDSKLGNQTFVKLLAKFDQVDQKDQHKMTPLALAVFSRSPKLIKQLIARGADTNVQINGRRTGTGDRALISLAATYGDADSIQALIDGGSSVNVVNALGQTPLHSVAAMGGDRFGRHQDEKSIELFTKAMRTLLAAKADPNAKNKRGQTPLALAASRDFFAAVELLVDRTDELDFELAGGSLLHWAAQNGMVKTSERLLETKKVDVNAIDSNGQSPLQVAAQNGDSKVIELLIANNANLDFLDNDGATALLLAASGGKSDVVKKLIAGGADTKKLDSSGHSALHLAAWAGDPKSISALLEHIKIADSITSSGYTPLHAAAWNGRELAIGALLAGGADPNVADSDGWTPLHKAAYRGHAKAVKTLIENGADKSIKNGVEMTALQLAKSNGKSEQIEPLLK